LAPRLRWLATRELFS